MKTSGGMLLELVSQESDSNGFAAQRGDPIAAEIDLRLRLYASGEPYVEPPPGAGR